MNALRHVLERAHGFLARFTLEESEIRKLEQRDRGQKPLGRSRAEHLARLVEHEQRAELAFVSEPANVQPSRFAERRQLKQSRELVAAFAEIDELAAGGDRVPLARRQVVERRFERGASVADGENTLAKHAASLVERHERQLRESVDLGKRLAQSLERGVGAG